MTVDSNGNLSSVLLTLAKQQDKRNENQIRDDNDGQAEGKGTNGKFPSP